MYSSFRYELMLKCWDSNPINRPSFSDLINIFDELLSIEHVSRGTDKSVTSIVQL